MSFSNQIFIGLGEEVVGFCYHKSILFKTVLRQRIYLFFSDRLRGAESISRLVSPPFSLARKISAANASMRSARAAKGSQRASPSGMLLPLHLARGMLY